VDTAEWAFVNTGKVQTWKAPIDGRFKIEAWGAGKTYSTSVPFGQGGYIGGEIELKKDQILYIYCGGQGVSGSSGVMAGGWNGGGTSGGASNTQSGGGGATDVRLVKAGADTVWDNAASIASRILVAGGGGGCGFGASSGPWGSGGNGGLGLANGGPSWLGTNNTTGIDAPDSGGKLTKGGTSNGTGDGKGKDGSLAKGGNGAMLNRGGGGGGGGYYGGAGGKVTIISSTNHCAYGGGGGSSWIKTDGEEDAIKFINGTVLPITANVGGGTWTGAGKVLITLQVVSRDSDLRSLNIINRSRIPR
jgi:hypothetical protein